MLTKEKLFVDSTICFCRLVLPENYISEIHQFFYVCNLIAYIAGYSSDFIIVLNFVLLPAYVEFRREFVVHLMVILIQILQKPCALSDKLQKPSAR